MQKARLLDRAARLFLAVAILDILAVVYIMSIEAVGRGGSNVRNFLRVRVLAADLSDADV